MLRRRCPYGEGQVSIEPAYLGAGKSGFVTGIIPEHDINRSPIVPLL